MIDGTAYALMNYKDNIGLLEIEPGWYDPIWSMEGAGAYLMGIDTVWIERANQDFMTTIDEIQELRK